MIKIGRWAAMSLTIGVGGYEAQAQTPIPPAPKDFVQAAAQSDRYEILAASVASVEAHDPRVRTFAQEMVRDHTRLADDLRKAATASGLPPPPPGLSSDQARLIGSLQSVTGSDFDKTYADQQELAHAQAVAVVGDFAAAGSEATLRKAAEAALPTIRDHLKMAQQLRIDLRSR